MQQVRKVPLGYYNWLGLLGLLTAVGVAAWGYSIYNGLGVTGMRNVVSWGIYIVTFAYFIKLSAGGLIMASAAEVFGVSAFRPLARLGVLTAACCVMVAGLTILPDLGRPERILNMVLHPNFTSPLVWDFCIITTYFLIAVGDLWLMTRTNKSEAQERYLKMLAYIGLPAAFMLHSITAMIFGLQISRPFWNSAIMAPLFVNSAILSGSALVTIIAFMLQRFGLIALGEETWRKLSGLMAVTLAIDFFFLGSKYITALWGNVPSEVDALALLLPGGELQGAFWLEWVICGLVPFVFLVAPRFRRMTRSVVSAAVLILVGVYSLQYELITVSLIKPLLQLAPGSSVGTYAPGIPVFQAVGQYHPTWVEYAVLLGLVAFAALLITIGYRWMMTQANLQHQENDKVGTGEGVSV